jgi:phage host-nuclease inhibitor protein Gam
MAVTAIDARRVLSKELAELYRLENLLQAEELRRAEAFRKLEDDYRTRAEPLRRDRERLLEKILTIAETHKGELITDDRRHIDLPHGRVGWRKKAAHLTITSLERLCEWAKKRSLVRTVVKPDLLAVHRYVDATGEVPEGMLREPPADTPYVKLYERGNATLGE